MTFDYATLPENLAAFCGLLRREYGFRSGPRELIDAARALEVTALADPRAVRHTLRPILSCTVNDALVFDEAFDRFFLTHGNPHLQSPPLPGAQTRETGAMSQRDEDRESGRSRDDEPFAATKSPLDGASVVDVSEVQDETASAATLRASYSPLEGEGAAPELQPPDGAWRAAAAALVQRLHAGLSRRWRPADRGERFDMRRTLRRSLHTGGDMVLPYWRTRLHRRPRFVMLVDGSRSMGAHAVPLQIAVALASVTRNIEAFVFSTAIRRITDDIRRAASGQRHRLNGLRYAWGGGTTIGGCLREFVRSYGERQLKGEVVVIIASDGLDVGAPGALRDAMSILHRRSIAILWLNPLVRTRGYEPTAAGMRAAMPFVSTFTWIDNAAELVQLSRLLL